MPDAAYFRAWRLAHPDYQARERARAAARRATVPRGDRSAEYARRTAARRAAREAAQDAVTRPFHGHPVLDQAREVVGPRNGALVALVDPLWDDLVMTAALAILERTEPAQAVSRYRSAELAWGRVTAPLMGDPRDSTEDDHDAPGTPTPCPGMAG
jgi:hypothetical protein